MNVVAATLVAVAWAVARPPGSWITQQRLLAARRQPIRPAALISPIGVAAGVGVLLAGLPPARLMVAMTIAGVGWFAARQVRAERVRHRAFAQRQAVAEALGLMAAELRSGILPRRVLAGLAGDFTFLAAAARAAELGGDVSSALRRESTVPGREVLSDLASAWMVAERTGAPLARSLDRLESSARDDREIEREVQSGVSPARATGRLMAVLPVVGLMMGAGMGGDPIMVLTSTVPGALCLAAGSVCACAGVTWVNHIAPAAERSR